MIKIIFSSFGRTLGRILCYIFIAFILFICFSSLKGEFQWDNFVEQVIVW